MKMMEKRMNDNMLLFRSYKALIIYILKIIILILWDFIHQNNRFNILFILNIFIDNYLLFIIYLIVS